MNSLLLAMRDWAGVVAIAISLAAFVVHFYEMHKSHRRQVTVRIGFGFIDDDDEEPGVWIEAVNTGSVPVRIAHWRITNEAKTLYGKVRKTGEGLAGAWVEPGDRATDVVDVYDLLGQVGDEKEVHAYVKVADRGRPFRSNWCRVVGSARPVTVWRRVLYSLGLFKT
jgi:hypothetical protein